MIIHLCIFLALQKQTVQASDPNCLRANPGILDADFTFFNRFEKHTLVTTDDVANHVALFSTRFKRAHEFVSPSIASLMMFGDGASLYRDISNRSFELFVTEPYNFEKTNLTTATFWYKMLHKYIMKINARNKYPIIGMYLGFPMKTYSAQLEVVESAFVSKQNTTFRIGHGSHDCLTEFRSEHAVKYFQRLNFLTCELNPAKRSSPEDSADEVISICYMIGKLATSIDITAEIMCSFGYPSYGTTTNGVVGTISNFQRFWCRVVNKVTQNKFLPRIIMQSAFDPTPEDYKDNDTNLHDARYHDGWWRRRVTTSYERSAFVEKVEELEGGKEPGNCTAECSICAIEEECCEGLFCFNDYSFQPFEIEKQPKVCQSLSTTCAPRHGITKPAQTSTSMQSTKPANYVKADLFTTTFTTLSFVASPDAQTTPTTTQVGVESFKDPFIIAIVILCVLLFVIGAGGYLLFYKESTNKIFTRKEARNLLNSSDSATDGLAISLQGDFVFDKITYDNTLEVSKQAFQIYEDNILGCGAFGMVLKGRIGSEEVAVKTTLPGSDKGTLKALVLELKVLNYIGLHENIVNLRAAHTSQLNSGKLYLFLELCPMGNLLQFLRNNRESFCDKETANITERVEVSQITCKTLLRWSVQIARAMEHLDNKKVVHADIAARNVLVFSFDQVKLTDFGLSRRLYEYANYVKNNQGPLPWRHMSIEALRDFNFSIQGDIWAFGITMWEIFSLGKVPYSGYSLSQDFVNFLLDGLRLSCPQHAHPLIYQLMTFCWTTDVQSRPPISLLLSQLTSILDEIYPDGIYFCPSSLEGKH